jgi:periplasmic protein TonB
VNASAVSRSVRAPSWAAPRWTWGAVVWSALLTALLFLALPFLEKITAPSSRDTQIRTIDTTALPPPPPPPPPPVRPPEPVRRDAPRPQMETAPPRLTPLALSLSLGTAMGGLQGDFFADFALAGLAAAPDASDYIFEIHELDEPPRAVAQLPPLYPAQARLRRIEGYVTLIYVVGADGRVGTLDITASEPAGLFDEAARQAVRRWRFEPGRRAGEAVPVRVQQRLSFQLESP